MAGLPLVVSDLAVAFGKQPTLDVPDLTVQAGGLVALTGPSGSGKTTLLHAMAGILRPTSGVVRWGDVVVSGLGEGARDSWRRGAVGLVFQDFHLFEQLSPLDNVLLPTTFSHFRVPEALRQRGVELLQKLGVPAKRRSVQLLSRGERQRVAIARALLFDPQIILADEPTASLDEKVAIEVSNIFAEVSSLGRTTIVVSHDPILISRCRRVIRLEHGRVVSDTAQTPEMVSP